MTTSSKPDFKKVRKIANELLITSNLTGSCIPLKVKAFVKEITDIVTKSFSNAEKYGIDINSFGSDSAVLIEKEGRYIIFYNDKHPKARIRFSILHELAHYLLRHSMDKKMSIDQYNKCEIEANFLASEILMPTEVILELVRRGVKITQNLLIDNFGVSKEAANKKIEFLRKYISKEWFHKNIDPQTKETLLFKFERLIDSIVLSLDLPNGKNFKFAFQSEIDSSNYYYYAMEKIVS